MTTQNIYNMTDTWTDGGTTYTSIKMNATDTASAAATLLMDLQVGSSSMFKVAKDGTFITPINVKWHSSTFTGTYFVVAGHTDTISMVSNAGPFVQCETAGIRLGGGGVIGAVQSLSGAGAVNITTLTTAFTSTGAGNALTLADGAVGQLKIIVHVADGGSGVLTPTNLANGTTVTFTAVGDTAILQFLGTEWWVVQLRGATLA